jgi:hypothetical protein
MPIPSKKWKKRLLKFWEYPADDLFSFYFFGFPNGHSTISSLRFFRVLGFLCYTGSPLASGYDRAQITADDHPEWPQAFLGKPYRFQKPGDALRQSVADKKDCLVTSPNRLVRNRKTPEVFDDREENRRR